MRAQAHHLSQHPTSPGVPPTLSFRSSARSLKHRDVKQKAVMLDERVQSTERVQATEVSPGGAQLLDWVRAHGGYVHPALAIVEHTPTCGCRGVIATEAISVTDLQDNPLVATPETLYMTSEAARNLLQRVRRPSSIFRLGREPPLGGVWELALLLAYERQKGEDSFWAPYINTLPTQPPCAWLMDAQQLSSELARLEGAAGGITHQAVQAASDAVQRRVSQLVDQYGRALDVSEPEVTWAVGQVVSRAFGSDQDMGMAPLIDMANHIQGADSPSGWEDESGQPLAVITSMRNGQLHELTTGEEFFISYMSSCTPLAAFLNFGFVPPELLSRAAVAPAVSTGTQATQRGERGSVLQGARSGRQDSGHGGRDDGDWSWPGFSAM